MTPNSYFTPLNNQSLLYPGQAERFRGQCVQSVMLWLKATGTEPPVYPWAYLYYERGIPGYTKISPGQPILEGDIIVWRKDFPPAIFNGVGNGHIDVASANGGLNGFSAWDSNWNPLILSHILHNGNYNNYIAGYLRKDNMPDPNQINQLVFFCWGPGKASQDDKDKLNSQPNLQAAINLILGDDRTGIWYEEVNKLVFQPSSKLIPYSGPQLFVEDK